MDSWAMRTKERLCFFILLEEEDYDMAAPVESGRLDTWRHLVG